MLSKDNYSIWMDMVLSDGSTIHLFHENVVNGKLMSKYDINNPNKSEVIYGMDVPTVVIPCGIPTSGKSTWIDRVIPTYTSISRDTIRYGMFGKDYKQNTEDEKLITHYFDVRVSVAIKNRRNIVLDNTHCKKSYLDAAIKRFEGTGYKIVVVFFDIPLWKAYLRNYKRKWMTGKWIPKHVIKQMYTNYKKINKNDYAAYKW